MNAVTSLVPPSRHIRLHCDSIVLSAESSSPFAADLVMDGSYRTGGQDSAAALAGLRAGQAALAVRAVLQEPFLEEQ